MVVVINGVAGVYPSRLPRLLLNAMLDHTAGGADIGHCVAQCLGLADQSKVSPVTSEEFKGFSRAINSKACCCRSLSVILVTPPHAGKECVAECCTATCV